MDLPVKEKTLKIYGMIHPKIKDLVNDALKDGTVFWGDVKRILENSRLIN